MRLYLAGPMTGLPEENRPAFRAAASRLRERGHDVVNPAELDVGNVSGWTRRDFLRRDLPELLTCEAVAVLPGWRQSEGATFEVYVARWFRMPILDAETLEPVADAPAEQEAENVETAGGTRFSAGKPPLVGAPVLGLLEVGRVAEYGARKYAPFDWHLGQSFSTLLNSAMRHMLRCVNAPLARDEEESGLLHLGHAAWNLLCLLHFIEEGRAEELDDITPWHGVSTAEKRRRTEESPCRCAS